MKTNICLTCEIMSRCTLCNEEKQSCEHCTSFKKERTRNDIILKILDVGFYPFTDQVNLIEEMLKDSPNSLTDEKFIDISSFRNTLSSCILM